MKTPLAESSELSGKLDSLEFIADRYLVAGTSDGQIVLFEVFDKKGKLKPPDKLLKKPVASTPESLGGGVYSLRVLGGRVLAVATHENRQAFLFEVLNSEGNLFPAKQLFKEPIAKVNLGGTAYGMEVIGKRYLAFGLFAKKEVCLYEILDAEGKLKPKTELFKEPVAVTPEFRGGVMTLEVVADRYLAVGIGGTYFDAYGSFIPVHQNCEKVFLYEVLGSDGKLIPKEKLLKVPFAKTPSQQDWVYILKMLGNRYLVVGNRASGILSVYSVMRIATKKVAAMAVKTSFGPSEPATLAELKLAARRIRSKLDALDIRIQTLEAVNKGI